MYNRVMAVTLTQALRGSSCTGLAFTGSGGKTTALFKLARELSATQPVLVTTSAHLGAWQIAAADQHLVLDADLEQSALPEAWDGILLVTGSRLDDRYGPPASRALEQLHDFCRRRGIPLLLESDGSRQKPLKGWSEHEPPIPPFVDQVVVVAGMSALGERLQESIVHRAELFAAVSGLGLDEAITAEAIARALSHPAGGQKNIPAGVRRVALLNQADTLERQAAAHGLARPLLTHYEAVVVASLAQGEVRAVHEPVAGVILAAGSSSRLGQPKQLLDWRGQPFVRAVAVTGLQAGLDPLVVVTGAQAEVVEPAVQDLPVQIVRNLDWASGQASSIRAGVKSLAGRHLPGAAVFLLADQPQVTPSVLQALNETHAQGLDPIVAPLVMDRRANPVLFDQVTFPDLLELQGDVGGRAIFHKHRVTYLPWQDDRLLLDVDTLEQYQRLIADPSL